MNNGTFLEAGKFLSVGLVNTFTGLLVIYAAKWFLHAGDVVANVIGYSIGLLVSYSLNSRWTFSYSGPQLFAMGKFVLVTLVAYAINLLTVMIAIHFFELNTYLAQALGVPPYTLTSFFASKYFVFRTQSY